MGQGVIRDGSRLLAGSARDCSRVTPSERDHCAGGSHSCDEQNESLAGAGQTMRRFADGNDVDAGRISAAVGGYDSGYFLVGGRFIPNCFIRLRNVLGGIPKRTAAPSGPAMDQFVMVRVCKICRRSSSLRSAGGGAATEVFCKSNRCSSIRNTGSRERINARSITFSSSRTLPGQV